MISSTGRQPKAVSAGSTTRSNARESRRCPRGNGWPDCLCRIARLMRPGLIEAPRFGHETIEQQQAAGGDGRQKVETHTIAELVHDSARDCLTQGCADADRRRNRAQREIEA